MPSRDSEYYIYDGNTVIEVEDTLFNVHRSALARDKSVFNTMFGLDVDPHLSSSKEGESDENPIRLIGDTADEFRALLWALYLLPHEPAVVAAEPTAALQLVYLARISHKYQFTSIENWALSSLAGHLTDHESTLILSSSSSPTLTQLTELASLCQHSVLLEETETRWMRLLMEGRDMVLSVQIAERLNLRGLLGLAYYTLMLKGRAFWDSETTLTRNQRVRLLSGHYALVEACDHLAGDAPELPHSDLCTGSTRLYCNEKWKHIWRVILEQYVPQMPTKLDCADLLGRVRCVWSILKAIVDQRVPGYELLNQMSQCCWEEPLLAVGRKRKEIQEQLANYFSDVPD